jgi:hypothetical protein
VFKDYLQHGQVLTMINKFTQDIVQKQIPDLHGLKAMTTKNYDIALFNNCIYFLIVMNFTVK